MWGIHNGQGRTVDVTKRVLIRGEGRLHPNPETTVDARGNCPYLRITRTCVVQYLDLDFTGFCEAIRATTVRRWRGAG